MCQENSMAKYSELDSEAGQYGNNKAALSPRRDIVHCSAS